MQGLRSHTKRQKRKNGTHFWHFYMTPESLKMTAVCTSETTAVNYIAVSTDRLMLKSTLQTEDREVD